MKNYTVLKILLVILVLFLLIITYPYLMNLIKGNDSDLELNGKGCVVLCYHRVLPVNKITSFFYTVLKCYTNNNELKLYSVTGSEFENHIKYFKKHNVKILSLEDLEYYIYNKIDLPDKSVIITFDDIDVSVYKNAYPILKKYKAPFALFVITGHVGNKDFKGLKLSPWHDIKNMYDSGLVSLGLHTHNYHYLNKKYNPPFINPKNVHKFHEDTMISIKTMEKNMGIKVRYFSYPYGFGIPETDEALLANDIKLIFTLAPGVVTKDDEAFFIKRVLIHEKNWDIIKNWIEDKE